MTVITDKKAHEKAVPILATDSKRLPKLLAALTPAERRLADAVGFDGTPDSFCVLPDAKGNVARVLAGVRDAADPWALAALPQKLPRGRYALGKGPVAIAPEDAERVITDAEAQFRKEQAAMKAIEAGTWDRGWVDPALKARGCDVTGGK